MRYPAIKLLDLDDRYAMIRMLYDEGYRFGGHAEFYAAWRTFLRDGGDTTATNPYIWITGLPGKSLTMYTILMPEYMPVNTPRQFISYLRRIPQ